MDQQKIKAIIQEAEQAASAAATKFFHETLGGRDKGSCGFAWVSIYKFQDKKIDGRCRLGKELKSAGVSQDWKGIFQIWNPSRFPCQNIDTLEVGARAAASVLQRYGFDAYADSRLD